MSPAVKCWRPEVHDNVLLFSQEVNIFGVFYSADLLAIEVPRDVVRRPLDLVYVPISTWGKPTDVPLVFGVILPDNVRAERVVAHGGHDFDVNLIPPLNRPVWSIPVHEEGCDGAKLVITLDPCPEFSIFKCLFGLDFTALVVGFGLGENGCSNCE